MRFDHRLCEDDADACRMAEVILRCLGYSDVKRGANTLSVDEKIPKTALLDVARYAERIARWARKEASENA